MKEQKIRLLSEQTINQIAAGEVIEQAASVIKELVDNSLDAQSKHILIETHNRFIRIADDGVGMHPDDLLLSIERHATSKISSIEDLDSIHSLGFRGEALSSIASISKLTLHSSPKDGEGMQIVVVGGKIEKIAPLPRKRGTTVEVSSLFFNVPVRKKFQKTLAQDTAEIHKLLTKLSLCYPFVGFSWESEGKPSFSFLEDTPLLVRIGTLLGEEYRQSLLTVEHASECLQLTGYIGTPSTHRPNRTGQHLFLNGRPIVSPWISQKILEGFGTRLPLNRYPIFVLHLQLPPEWVDVNVHPQKKEVRLCEEEKISRFLQRAIEKNLQSPQEKSPLSITLQKVIPSLFSLSNPQPTPPKTEEALPLPLGFSFHLLAIVGRFLLLEDPLGVRLVDVPRARLVIACEELFHINKKSSVQTLWFPLQLEFSGAESLLLAQALESLEQLGIGIRPFGKTTFLVDSLPTCLKESEIKEFLCHFLEGGSLSSERRIQKSLAKTLKQSVRTHEEAHLLLTRLFQCQDPEKTIEGKPIQTLLTEEELARKFD